MEVIRYDYRSFILFLYLMRVCIWIFKLTRSWRFVAFVQNFQKIEYRSVVSLFLMLLFATTAHWFDCILHFLDVLQRPNVQVQYSWLDHLSDEYKMPYRIGYLEYFFKREIIIWTFLVLNNTLNRSDLESKYLTALFFANTLLTSVSIRNIAAIEKIISSSSSIFLFFDRIQMLNNFSSSFNISLIFLNHFNL